MRYAGIMVALGLLLAAGSCGKKPADMGDLRQSSTRPGMETAEQAHAIRVPPGFKSKDGTTLEPYSKTGWAKEIVHEKTGIEMVFIPAGEFLMGSPPEESKWPTSESPVHHVRVTRPFYLGKYEVTQGERDRMLGNNAIGSKDKERLPAGGLSWEDCQDLLKKAGDGLRLPMEAQWEYACRAGTRTAFHTGNTISTDDANYNGEQVFGDGQKGIWRNVRVEVGSFKPNAFGLYDMHGNILEWCADWEGWNYYAQNPEDDPAGPSEGTNRVQRGGSLYYGPKMCRSASRIGFVPTIRHGYSGFRVALDLK